MATRRAATASTGSKAPKAASPAPRRTPKKAPTGRKAATKARRARQPAAVPPIQSENPAEVDKGGRPPIVFTPYQLRQMETLAGYGLTQASIAAVIGVNPETLTNKKQTVPEVSQALARGKAVAEAAVGQALYTKAKKGDIKAITWWEMTRAGRSSRQHVQTEELPTLVVERE